MLLSPIITRLLTTVTDFRRVAGAMDFASAAQDLKIPPAAYVLPLMDRAGPNELINATSQLITERFGVVIAAKNLADVRGEKARVTLEPLRDAVITALLGWAPSAEYEPITYSSGRLLHFDDAVLWWQLDFVTGYYVRA